MQKLYSITETAATYQPPNFKVLIVEDSSIQAEIIRRVVADAGYQVALATNGQTGLEVARKIQPDLILSDVNMPLMNGFELCRAIRADEKLGRKCVVMLTTLIEVKGILEALNSGADDYLLKPFKPETLLRVVRNNLTNSTYFDNDKQTFRVTLPDGGRHEVRANPRQTLNLLVSTYSNVVEQNHELIKMRNEVVRLNTNLTEKVKTKTDELHVSELKIRQTLIDSIQAIIATLEARDPYTAGHQRNVAENAVLIAEQLGLPAEVIFSIHLAGVVHDIGKVSTPAEILNKPGHLTQNQYALVQEHSEAGYNILRNIDFPWPIAEMVYQHHERINGQGYPRGLSGDAILLEAKILMVADVLDAMVSHRPYRPSLGPEAAKVELIKNRGEFYDPEVVDACIKLMEAGKLPVQSQGAVTTRKVWNSNAEQQKTVGEPG